MSELRSCFIDTRLAIDIRIVEGRFTQFDELCSDELDAGAKRSTDEFKLALMLLESVVVDKGEKGWRVMGVGFHQDIDEAR